MRLICLTPLLLLAACGSGGTKTAPADNAAADFVPPPTQSPTPIPGQEHSNPITAYVGKYPGDAVDGVGFYDRTEVSHALIDAVGDDKVRRRFTTRDQVSIPIWQTKDGRIAAHGCESHNCSDADWTFVLAADGTRGQACYHDAVTMGQSSRWYVAGAAPQMRPGDCPQG
jgi:hypothetical protein